MPQRPSLHRSAWHFASGGKPGRRRPHRPRSIRPPLPASTGTRAVRRYRSVVRGRQAAPSSRGSAPVRNRRARRSSSAAEQVPRHVERVAPASVSRALAPALARAPAAEVEQARRTPALESALSPAPGLPPERRQVVVRSAAAAGSTPAEAESSVPLPQRQAAAVPAQAVRTSPRAPARRAILTATASLVPPSPHAVAKVALAAVGALAAARSSTVACPSALVPTCAAVSSGGETNCWCVLRLPAFGRRPRTAQSKPLIAGHSGARLEPGCGRELFRSPLRAR